MLLGNGGPEFFISRADVTRMCDLAKLRRALISCGARRFDARLEFESKLKIYMNYRTFQQGTQVPTYILLLIFCINNK